MLYKIIRIECVCPSCGLIMMVPQYKVDRGLGVYCSRACQGMAKRVGRVERDCPNCGTHFTGYPATSTQAARIYCSKQCYHAAQTGTRSIRTCVKCGAPFATNPSRQKRFCSPECSLSRFNRSVADRFWEKVDRTGGPDACWPWTGSRLARGYGNIRIGSTVARAHRLSWEMHNGPIPDGLFVCHHCDNPPCVNPAHLFLGTVADNTHDMISKGRQNQPKGEQHPNAKLTESDAQEIRRLYEAGAADGVQLGKRFGVNSGVVYGIVRGKSWRHLASSSPDDA